MKKFMVLSLALLMLAAFSVTAFASEPSDVIYIDATEVSESELYTMVLEAQDGVNTIVVSWGDATATIAPVVEPEITPFFNLNKTYKLTTEWLNLGDDYIITSSNSLKVTNNSGNPGAIDVAITYPDYLDTTTDYYWGLKAGYYTTFTITTYRTAVLWVKASSVAGSYSITAKN